MMQEDLFFSSPNKAPLAERMRPHSLSELLGQDRIAGPNSMLALSIEKDELPSLILWGPPGCGKTSLAEVIRNSTKSIFHKISAVHSGVKEIKDLLQQAKHYSSHKRTILFIDEIHRFNKAQQDSLLHAVEEGWITLIGATTENPGFEINSALLSRCQLLLLAPLGEKQMNELIDLAVYSSPRGLLRNDIQITPEVRNRWIAEASGDARFLLNQIEWTFQLIDKNDQTIDHNFLEKIAYHKPLRYDKSGEEHYNLISALHKSVRGSDVQAAVYWLHRMIKGGEDPRYILRRLQRMAVEDIGLADPQALILATAAQASFDFLGVPEGLLAIDQLVIYLSTAPKSNKVEIAAIKADEIIAKTGNLPVPKAFRNPVTSISKKLGYGDGYKYDHNSPNAYSAQEHLPKSIEGMKFYEPTDRGYEKDISNRLKNWDKQKE
jgi:putative ATPase